MMSCCDAEEGVEDAGADALSVAEEKDDGGQAQTMPSW